MRMVNPTTLRDRWEDFLGSLNSDQSAAELLGRINALSGKRKSSPIALNIERSNIFDPPEVAEALVKYFADLAAVDA